MPSPLRGAWTLISDDRTGMAVFTERHYSMLEAAKDRPGFAAEEPTDAEAAAAFRTFQGAAGTYRIEGTTVILKRLANRNPQWSDEDITWDFDLDGDALTLGDRRFRRAE